MRTWWLLVWACACGRIGFAELARSGDASSDGPATVPAPNCDGLAATCGPSGDGDCCAAFAVPGGSFYLAYDTTGDGMYPSMAFPATVSAFTLDAYEVTVGRFRAFVAAGMGTQQNPVAADAGAHAAIGSSGWQTAWNAALEPDTPSLIGAIDDTCTGGSDGPPFHTWTDAAGSDEDLPMDCATWYEEFAFCIWDGGYLPTVAEQMFAAAGGSDQRAYPWSNPPDQLELDPTRATYFDGSDCDGGNDPGCGLASLVPVGSKPDGVGKWGHSDLAGNVSEASLDWAPDGNVVFPVPCDDCATLDDPGSHRRSTYEGAFDTAIPSQRSAALMFSVGPAERWRNCGFRCARP